MKITGIICEYNPLHLGHKKQLDLIRNQLGKDCGIVCLMSGNFVQRGQPAIIDKSLRAKAAIASGADLVLELPLNYSLSSAEGFAAGGVSILSPFCDSLCFGAETDDRVALMQIAQALISPSFSPVLRTYLDQGLSFPAARQAALENMGLNARLLISPNNILAVEYCKAILSQKSKMEPLLIHREGNYHALTPDRENPSATSLRHRMLSGESWQEYVPAPAREIFQSASLHTIAAGERAVLGKLRTMTEEEFALVPYGSEGLWRKLMHSSRQEATLDAIIESVKSKRYTRTRIDRMILCAFLGLTQADLDTPAPYTRVLAFNDRGREILKKARETDWFPNSGENTGHPWQEMEYRAGDLYGLFSTCMPESPGMEARRRICHIK